MLKRIALVAPRGYSTHCLRGLLSNPIQYLVSEYHSMETVNSHLATDPFELLIIRFPRFTKEQVNAVAKLRRMFPRAAVLSLSPDIDPGARFEVRSFVAHKVLDEVTERDDLEATIDSLLSSPQSKQRLHPRVRRKGAAEVFEGSGQRKIDAQFLDFAQMGARLSVDAGEELQPKSQIRIAYRSSTDPGRVHRIECLVMWVEGNSLTRWIHGARREIGVRFIAAV